ncbi:hypothetical protein MMPV_006426 [Pyropia vietnamensis]
MPTSTAGGVPPLPPPLPPFSVAGSAIVVGAGLAGCLTAVALGRRGWAVTLLEYRDDPRAVHPAGDDSGEGGGGDGGHSGSGGGGGRGRGPVGRSINLALSTRGLTALAAVAGLGEADLGGVVLMHGRALHPRSGGVPKLQAYGQPGEALRSVGRATLNKVLLDAAAGTAGVTTVFCAKVVAVDVDTPSVTYVPQQGLRGAQTGKEECAANAPVPNTLTADLVVGADGSFSKVRSALARRPWFDYAQSYVPAAYKELHIPAAVATAAAADGTLPREFLHIWPRGRYMLIALPNADGSFTVTLFLDAIATADGGGPSFASLDAGGPAAVTTFFRAEFPDALPLLPDLVADWAANPTAALPTVRCAPYHYASSVVLVGDAAHAIVPFYGQGCNAALEDVRVLANLLDDAAVATPSATAPSDPAAADGTSAGGGDGIDGGGYSISPVSALLATVLPAYSAARVPSGHTIADLALGHYDEMAAKTASPAFLALRRVRLAVQAALPRGLYTPLYSLISFSNVPYADAVARAARDDAVASAVAAVLGGVVAVAGSQGVMRLLRAVFPLRRRRGGPLGWGWRLWRVLRGTGGARTQLLGAAEGNGGEGGRGTTTNRRGWHVRRLLPRLWR